MTIFTDGLRQSRGVGIDELDASLGESLGASAGEAFESLPSVSLTHIVDLTAAQSERRTVDPGAFGMPFSDMPELPASTTDLPIDQARARVKEAGLEKSLTLPDGPTIKAPALDIMINRARERREREATIARGPGGIVPGALGVGTSLLVSVLDPLNVAAAFIPVVGEARYAKLMANAGESIMARAAVRGGVGAASGAVGMAAIEPLEYAARNQAGQEYTFADALRSVAYGAALGSFLHTAGGGIADVIRARRGQPVFPFAEGEPFARGTAAEAATGVRQNAPARANDVASAQTPLGEAPSANENIVPPQAAGRAVIPPAAPAKVARPQSLLEFIAARGGISKDDPLVSDFLTSFGGKNPKVAGRVLVREGGRRLDDLRAGAVEAGYLHDAGDVHGGVSDVTIDDLLQAVDAEARGTKQFPRGEEGYISPDELAAPAEEDAARRQERFVTAREEVEADLAERELPESLHNTIKRLAVDRMRRDPDLSTVDAIRQSFDEFSGADAVVTGLADLPPQAHHDALRGAIAALHDGEPVRVGEMLEEAAKTNPRIAESLELWHGSPHAPSRSRTSVSINGRTVETSQEWDPAGWQSRDLDQVERSQAADRLPEPASLAPEPSARVAAAEQALAAAEADFKASKGYLPADLRERVERDIAGLDLEAKDRAHVIEQGAACLAAAMGTRG